MNFCEVVCWVFISQLIGGLLCFFCRGHLFWLWLNHIYSSCYYFCCSTFNNCCAVRDLESLTKQPQELTVGLQKWARMTNGLWGLLGALQWAYFLRPNGPMKSLCKVRNLFSFPFSFCLVSLNLYVFIRSYPRLMIFPFSSICICMFERI